jgi:hypothetical protein
MNIATERKRFRRQFNDEQWVVLTADTKFMTAWDSDDIIRAGERVADILIGTRKSNVNVSLVNAKNESKKQSVKNY